MYIVLSESFTLKRSKKEKILLDLVNGKRYILGEDQFDFLLQLNGLSTIDEILKEYDKKSKEIILIFVEELKNIGAVNYLYNLKQRRFHLRKVPELRLQLLHLEATSKCNMRCAHCYQGEMYPVSENISIEEIKTLVKEMKQMQVESLSISGGEPFYDKKTLEIARIAEENEIRVSSFFTNGVLLDSSIIEKIVNLKSNPTLFVSVDAISPKAMAFRGVKSEDADRQIRKIFKAIDSLTKREISVVVNTVVNACNINDLKEMYDLIGSYQIKSWRVGYPKKTGFFKEKNKFDINFQEMLEATYELLKYHFFKKRISDLQIEYLYRKALFENFQKVEDDDFVCDYESRRESCCVKPNGDVVACAYCNSMPLGNIKRKSLSDIWYSPEMQKIKNTKIKDVKGCVDCNLRSYCASGCRANAYFLNGDYQNGKDDYACEAVKFFKDKVIPLIKKKTGFEPVLFIPA